MTNIVIKQGFFNSSFLLNLSGELNSKVQLVVVLTCNAHVYWNHYNSHLSCALLRGGCHLLYAYLQRLTPNTKRSLCIKFMTMTISYVIGHSCVQRWKQHNQRWANIRHWQKVQFHKSMKVIAFLMVVRMTSYRPPISPIVS